MNVGKLNLQPKFCFLGFENLKNKQNKTSFLKFTIIYTTVTENSEI